MSDIKADDKPKTSPPRTGHVKPADPALTEWLEKLWTRGNPPDRLELWWMLGANKDVRRGLVFYENFAQDKPPLDLEQCTRLAGEILTAAQNWTDSKRRLCWFEVAITDFHQQTVPLSRPVGPLLPQQAYAGVRPDGEPQGPDEEDDGEIGLKPITHKYLSKMTRSVDRALGQAHAAIGDVIQLQQGIIVSQQSHVERLQNANMQIYAQMQDAADRATERAMWIKREEMKIKAIGSGLKVGENLVYGWFGMSGEQGSTDSGQANGTAAPAGRRLHAASPEQRLTESFLEEAAEEKLSVQLFGDWQNTDKLTLPDIFAGLGQDKPGIFSAQQFGILLGVREGVLPPEALDALLPDSGKSAAITLEQMTQAQPLLTQGMMVALNQIRDLRLMARDRRQAQRPSGPSQNGEAK